MTQPQPTALKDALEIPLSLIEPDPDQPRKERVSDADLQARAKTIKRFGLLQPIYVRPLSDSDRRKWPDMGKQARYVIVAGEQRFLASRMAGKHTIPALVRNPNRQESFLISMIENSHRTDMNPMDQARGYAKAMQDYGWSVNRLSEEVSVSVNEIRKRLSLLKVGPDVQQAVTTGTISSALLVDRVKAPNARKRLIGEMATKPYNTIKAEVARAEAMQRLHAPQPRITGTKPPAAPPYDWEGALGNIEAEIELMTRNLQTSLALTPKRRKAITDRLGKAAERLAEMETAITR